MDSTIDNTPNQHQQLAILRLDHRELDERINELIESREVNQFEISRLKKRKLRLKDQIAKLESQIIPDLLA